MLKVAFIFLFFYSLHSLAADNKAFSIKQKTPGFLHLVTYDTLTRLPAEKKSAYLANLREYLEQQESKWRGKSVATNDSLWNRIWALRILDEAFGEGAATGSGELTPPSPRPFEAAGCDNLQALPASLSKFVVNGRNKCLIGGQLVCLNYSHRRLRCNAAETQFQAYANSLCHKPGEVPCAAPFYLDENGDILCVKSRRADGTPRAISPQCKSRSNIDDLIKNLEKNPQRYANFYETYRRQFEEYCGKEGSNAHYFDVGDCRALQTRLDKIQVAVKINTTAPSASTGALADEVPCHSRLLVNGSNLEVKLHQKDKKYKTEIVGDSQGWRVVKCYDHFRLQPPLVADHDFHEQSYATCMVRVQKVGHAEKTETLQFDDGFGQKCVLNYFEQVKATADKKERCEAQIDGKKLWAQNGKGYITDASDQSGVNKTELEEGNTSSSYVTPLPRGASRPVGAPYLIYTPILGYCTAYSFRVPYLENLNPVQDGFSTTPTSMSR